MGWLYNINNWISKAMPNELSKLNSWSDELAYIPYVGTALSAVMKAGSTIDNASTAYVDTRDQGASSMEAITKYGIPAGMKGIQSQSWDPGTYGSPGVPLNRDWANTIGQVGNSISFGKSSSDGLSVSGNNAMDIFNNPYLFGSNEAQDVGEQIEVPEGLPVEQDLFWNNLFGNQDDPFGIQIDTRGSVNPEIDTRYF